MSVLPQELLRKISTSADESSKHRSTREVAQGRFRELLQVQPVEERPQGGQLFPFMIEEEEIEEEASPCCEPLQGVAAPSVPLILSSSSMTIEVSPAAALEAPALEAAFEKMAGTMILMTCTGDRETTLFLDNPKFAASCLFGTQVTIREFSTAPKAFNIEILSNTQGVALMDAGKSALLSSFQNGSFPFTIHRFDAHIQQSEERPAFHRKESSDGEQKEQKEGRQ